jgi:D-alanine-D-alanine ligase
MFGGRSVEHEVSVTSARAVARAMAEGGLECIPVAITKRGQWLSARLSTEILDGEAAAVPEAGDAIRWGVEPGRGLVSFHPGAAPEAIAVDAVFPLVHGWGGEDGRMQGALELAGVPYVGSGVTGSAVGMDKAISKGLFAVAGIPIGPWIAVSRLEWREDRAAVVEAAGGELGYPLFVKPANGGSSVGISKVDSAESLPAAIEAALEHDSRLVIERGLAAHEIECAVLGNERPEASGLGEIVPGREFYDYEAKYHDDSSRLIIPAPLPEEVTDRVREFSLAAFRALDLAGFARVDFLVERGTHQVYINEVNTLPGFTPISMFPKLWAARGLPFPDLVRRLVELALERETKPR